MKSDDVTHLASLARIALSEEEVGTYGAELAQIVDYVSAVSDIADSESDTEPQVGARYNIMREDVVTNEPDTYTEDILREMPQTQGRHMVVKKILDKKG